jgi:hypothetical protein
MQNSNEAYFKNKYLKYKAKYLELKDLLEGGVPTPAEEKAETDCKAIKDKKECINIKNPGCEIAGALTIGKCNFNKKAYQDAITYPGLERLKHNCIEEKEDCNKISQYCNGKKTECKFVIKEEEKAKAEAEQIKKEEAAKKKQAEYEECKKIVITRPNECFNLKNETCCKDQKILCKWDRPKDKKVSMCMRKSEKLTPQEEEEIMVEMKKIVEDAERQHGVLKK